MIGRFAKDESGAVAIIAAASMTALLWTGGFAVDIGMLHLERRHAQGAVDLAAVAAAADIGNARQAAEQVLAANDLHDYQSLEVETGNYVADPDLPPDSRFRPGASPLNAARVHLKKTGKTYFARYLHDRTINIGVTGTAANADYAAFSAGSRLFELNGGLANRLLSALLGTNLSLTALDYESMLDARVNMLSFLDALNTEASLEAATYEDVLLSEVTMSDLAAAAAEVTNANGDTSASFALQTIAATGSALDTPIDLGKIVDLGPLAQKTVGSSAPGYDAAVSALELVTASAAIANSDRQVAIDLGATVPGLASVKLDIAIGEPPVSTPWVQLGQADSAIYTAQLRLRLIAEVGGTGTLAGTRVRIPLYIEAAHAEARLAAVQCFGGKSVTVAARPGVASVHLADADGFGSTSSPPVLRKARLVTLPLAEISGRSSVTIENSVATELTFSAEEIASQTVKTASTEEFAGSLVGSILEAAELEARILGLALAVPAGLTSAVAAVLQTAAAPIDSVLNDVLAALGIRVGSVDVSVHGIRCSGGGYLTG
jgi:uncharacterized membrane protein